jgi:hypothetical protein
MRVEIITSTTRQDLGLDAHGGTGKKSSLPRLDIYFFVFPETKVKTNTS